MLLADMRLKHRLHTCASLIAYSRHPALIAAQPKAYSLVMPVHIVEARPVIRYHCQHSVSCCACPCVSAQCTDLNGGPYRLESVSAVLANTALDDPLENAEQLADQMDSLPFIFRFEYEEMNQYFCSVTDPIVAAYSRGLAPGAAGSPCMLCLNPQQCAVPNTLQALANATKTHLLPLSLLGPSTALNFSRVLRYCVSQMAFCCAAMH